MIHPDRCVPPHSYWEPPDDEMWYETVETAECPECEHVQTDVEVGVYIESGDRWRRVEVYCSVCPACGKEFDWWQEREASIPEHLDW